MSDDLRRLYNRFERFLDFAALREERRTEHPLRLPREPLRARAALALALPHAQRLDRGALLKGVAAENGLRQDGSAAQWDLFFDLPARRAKLALQLEVDVEDEARATLHGKAWPYPAPDSPFRRMAAEGRILHRQLVGQWRRELARTPAVPLSFRDSDAVLADLIRAGLDTDLEYALATGVRPDGRLGWQAQTRRDAYWAGL